MITFTDSLADARVAEHLAMCPHILKNREDWKEYGLSDRKKRELVWELRPLKTHWCPCCGPLLGDYKPGLAEERGL